MHTPQLEMWISSVCSKITQYMRKCKSSYGNYCMVQNFLHTFSQKYQCVTKFSYLLYWDIKGAPRHIPGQALFCVNIGNGWNIVCNNCFNYSNLYWVKLWVIWIHSDFEFKYIRLIIRYWFLLYYTLFRRWDLFRSSFASAGNRLGQSYCTVREELGG